MASSSTGALVQIGLTVLTQMPQLISTLQAARSSMSVSEQTELDRILTDIHEQNLKLASDIDDAAREAEKKG